MKRLIERFRDIIDFLDGKLEHSKWKPAWDTISTFFFSSRTVTPSSGPHIRDNTDLKRYMSVVMGAVAPTVLVSVYLFGWRSLALVVMCYTLGIVIEMGFAVVNKEEVTEGMFVTCMLYPMILPPTIPFWMAAVGLAVGIILGKEVFGGTGKNIFNPAIVGRVFIAVTFPVEMASRWATPYDDTIWRGLLHWSKSADAVSAASPLIDFKNGQAADIMDMLIGTTSGSLGETSAILIFVCGIFLVLTRVANWRLPLSTLVAAMATATIMNMANPTYATPLYHLAGGGLLFGAFYMVTDPVSSPFTSAGKWVYGTLIGVITIIIRNMSGFPEGMMFAILFMNMFAPVIDDAVLAVKFKKADRI